ncbi:MAG: hypothetical protein GX817_00720 [Elusimicrobia bacterium]|nr:hypothetical protein [Elusimicrobiota bacterium]
MWQEKHTDQSNNDKLIRLESDKRENALMNEISSVRKKYESLLSKVEEKWKKDESYDSARETALEEEIARLQSEINRVSGEAIKKDFLLNELKSEYEVYRDETAKYVKELGGLKSQPTQEDTYQEKFLGEKEKFVEVLSSTQRKISSLEDKYESELFSSSVKINRLEDMMSHQNKRIEEIELKLAELLKAPKREFLNENADLAGGKEIDYIERESQRIQEELYSPEDFSPEDFSTEDVSIEKISAEDVAVEGVSVEKISSKDEVDQLNLRDENLKGNAELKLELDSLTNELKVKDRELDSLRELLSSKDLELASLADVHGEIKTKDLRINELEEELNQANSDMKELENKISSGTENTEAEIIKKDEKINELSLHIETLTESIKELEDSSAEALNEDLKTRDEEIERLKNDLEEADSRVRAEAEKLQDKESVIQELKTELEEALRAAEISAQENKDFDPEAFKALEEENKDLIARIEEQSIQLEVGLEELKQTSLSAPAEEIKKIEEKWTQTWVAREEEVKNFYTKTRALAEELKRVRKQLATALKDQQVLSKLAEKESEKTRKLEEEKLELQKQLEEKEKSASFLGKFFQGRGTGNK